MSAKDQIIYPLLLTLSGFTFAYLVPHSNYTHTTTYTTLIYGLLAIGLYGSVATINIQELQANRFIVINAITIGVLLKTAIIGYILFIFLQHKLAFLLGVIVAQIDPLSVSLLLQKHASHLSERAKTILGAWSSFDDPMTVIISLYISSALFPNANSKESIESFILDFALNIALAVTAYLLYRLNRGSAFGQYVLLATCFAIAIYFRFMLGISIIGLFLRPTIKSLPKIVTAALFLSLILLGLILADAISVKTGLVMAAAAIIAQICVGFLLTVRLNWQDRLYLSFAQQNGITAIILSLLYETIQPGIIAVVAPAIFIINIGHYTSNRLISHLLKDK